MIGASAMGNRAREIAQIYAAAQSAILSATQRAVKKGQKAGTLLDKSAQARKLKEEALKIYGGATSTVATEIEKAINDAYRMGIASAETDLGIRVSSESKVYVPYKITRLADDIVNNLDAGKSLVLRQIDDVYREVVGSVVGSVLTGTQTRLKATQEALNKFADQGINGFIDKSGRHWGIDSYTEMAVRTSTMNAALAGHVDRQVAAGRDLVVVSDHFDECPRCRPWEGKILSLSGNNPDYGSYQNARSNGLFHPNCGHTITGYIEGLTVIPEPQASPKNYEAREKQRSIERQIRKWKSRELVALTPDEAQKAKNKVKFWQGQQREHVKDNNLRRKPERESLNARTGKKGVAGKPPPITPPPVKPKRTVKPKPEPKPVIQPPPPVAQQKPEPIKEVYGQTKANLRERVLTDASRRLPKDARSVVDDVLDRAHPAILKAEKALQAKTQYRPTFDAMSGRHPHFSPSNFGVEFNLTNDVIKVGGGKYPYHVSGMTLLHEHGHSIDYELGKPSADKTFTRAMLDDFSKLRAGRGTSQLIADLRNDKRLLAEEAQGVQDVLGGLVGMRKAFPYGHSDDYWQREGMLEAELFAHIAAMGVHPLVQESMELYFPTAIRAFNRLVENAVMKL